MPMTVVVTRNVASRVRGYLASVMCEVAPGVYTAPRMSKSVRQRVWDVIARWCGDLGPDRGVIMTWPDRSLPGGQEVRILGSPAYDMVEKDGVFLCRGELTAAERGEIGLRDPDVPF